MDEELFGFMLVLTRVSAFFLVIPIFGWRSIPVRVRVAVAVLVSIFFSMIVRPVSGSGRVEMVDAILYLVQEAIYGLALGLAVTFVFYTVRVAGRIIERQMGLALAAVLDPFTGERAQPVGMLLEMIFILIFLAANGHHLFLLVLSRSFEVFPAGSIPSAAILVGGVMKTGSTMFLAALRLAAPILAAFVVLLVVLAVFARVVPEMNILFISLPLRVGLGLLMITMILPFIHGFTSEFADWIGRLLPC